MGGHRRRAWRAVPVGATGGRCGQRRADPEIQPRADTRALGMTVSQHRSSDGDASRAAWLKRARTHLRKEDPVLARIIERDPTFDPRVWLDELPPMDIFGAALFQVTGQQLSVASTRRTIGRIETLFDGHLPSPAELLAVEPIQLRAAGLSRRKVDTLRDLAERLSDGRLDEDPLAAWPDDDFISA